MIAFCERCGLNLADGALRYLVTIHATADFDGTIPDTGAIEDLEAFMRRLDAEDPKKLEQDVYQSKAFILCPACKAEVMKHPLRPPEPAATPTQDDDEGRVH